MTPSSHRAPPSLVACAWRYACAFVALPDTGPEHMPTALDALNPAYAVRVSSEHSELTVWPARRDNHAFRAWHDRTHGRLGLGTSYAEELAVGAEQAREYAAYCATRCISEAEEAQGLAVLWADTAGQTIAHLMTRRFPSDQAAFVERLLSAAATVE